MVCASGSARLILTALLEHPERPTQRGRSGRTFILGHALRIEFQSQMSGR